jgi:hypothetical protein
MTQEERTKLEDEWKELNEKLRTSQFPSPKDMRRKEEITSLLMTNGESGKIQFKFVRGRQVTKGLNTKGYHDHGGKTGL